MSLLGLSKAQIDGLFEFPMFGESLLDDIRRGEKNWEYDFGNFHVNVGFYDDVARYAAFTKKSGMSFNENDMRSVLALVAPISKWKESASIDNPPKPNPKKPDDQIGSRGNTTFFEFSGKDGAQNDVD